MSAADLQKCPDCGAPLHAIRLIETVGYATQHYDLRYAALDARKSAWTGKFPIEGRIRGLLCDACGRVALYAVPESQE